MVKAQFKILSWHVPGGAEKNHEKIHWGNLVSRLTSEPRTCWIRCRSDQLLGRRRSVLLHEVKSLLISEHSVGYSPFMETDGSLPQSQVYRSCINQPLLPQLLTIYLFTSHTRFGFMKPSSVAIHYILGSIHTKSNVS
jgi:hypothetical protein